MTYVTLLCFILKFWFDMIFFVIVGVWFFVLWTVYTSMRKNEWSSVLALAHFVLPVFLVRYGKVVFSGTVRRKIVLSVVIMLFYFLVPGLILLSRWLWNLGVRVEQISFVATKVFVLGWFKPIVLVEGLGEFKIQLLNLMIFSVLLLALNLFSLRFVPKNYSQVIAGIMKDFVPGFSTATKMKASQAGNVVTVKTDAFADIWTLYGHREKIENRIADNIHIVELMTPKKGVYEFHLGNLKLSMNEDGEFVSDLKWTECEQIDSRKDVRGMWMWNIGSNGKRCLLNLRSHPNYLATGPPRHGKSTSIQHIYSLAARQNPQSIFVVYNPSKPSDHAMFEKDFYEVNGLLTSGNPDERFAGKTEKEKFASARRLDNFILLRSELDINGLVRWLENELIRRNDVIESRYGSNQFYEMIETDSNKYRNKLDTPREAAIFVNICELTDLRTRFGEKGNDIANGLNIIETIALKAGNRSIHIIIDSQDATIKTVGFLRRSSMISMFNVTQAEIEFTFGVKTQPLQGIGIATVSDKKRGIKTMLSPMIEWRDVSKHITDADRSLTRENREIARGLRRAIKHEAGENDQELMIDGQAAVLKT